jgi:hypothetical protein
MVVLQCINPPLNSLAGLCNDRDGLREVKKVQTSPKLRTLSQQRSQLVGQRQDLYMSEKALETHTNVANQR